jgi:hypothetical protein
MHRISGRIPVPDLTCRISGRIPDFTCQISDFTFRIPGFTSRISDFTSRISGRIPDIKNSRISGYLEDAIKIR